MKVVTLTTCYLLFILSLNAQISGTITDTREEPLPFASIYIKGTSKGTTSNIQGNFELDLAPGKYDLVFQYVGYQQKIVQLQVTPAPQILNIELVEETVELKEIVVNANAEDPAYPVIRKAIAKRKYYKDLVETYSCEVYIKGNIKFLDAPESFMGFEIGDLGGSLDSNRQGIYYLSESKSKLHFQAPNHFKEEMLYSKVSGSDNRFGFNRATEMNFNLYENYAEIGRQIVSPVASNALQYYKYRLVGTIYDEAGRLLNKIEVIPKRSEDPVYRGYIYIVEELWNIQSVDLLLVKGAMKWPGLDSLYLKQVHVPIKEPDTWRLFSQSIHFKAGSFGFKLIGDFTGIYTQYQLQTNFEGHFFNNEIFRVESGANEQTYEFWDSIRPIPLTKEEAVDYERKDSIKIVRESKTYLDSTDAKNNTFKPADLLFGYTYRNSYKRKFFAIRPPITALQFNTVQGYNLRLGLVFGKRFDEHNIRRLFFRGNIEYGFSEKRLRINGNFTYRINQKYQTYFTVSGGTNSPQFAPSSPISRSLNSLLSLTAKKNYMKIYDKTFGRIGFGHELFNGIYLNTSVEYSRRKALVNNSNHSLFSKDRAYTSNNPLDSDSFEPFFTTHEAFIWNVYLRFRYKQKYITYPDRKFIQGSKLPDFNLIYRRGMNWFGSDVNFNHLAINIAERYLPIGVLGYLQFIAEGGIFFGKSDQPFIDYKHFNGNQTNFGNPSRYLSRFLRLPYYDYSTNEDYFQLKLQHHFDGFLLDKIPGIRKLGITTVFSFGLVYTQEKKEYLEIALGLDQIGIGAFRWLRFDVVLSHQKAQSWDLGYVIGIRLPIRD